MHNSPATSATSALRRADRGLLWWLLLLAALTPLPLLAATPQDRSGWTENGEATWYGPRHAGRRTTSGERFNPLAMTAAHPSLPMGSIVRVTVQETGRSVVVRVNDREPPHGVRVIDLSEGAAARLGIVRRGAAMVTIDQAGPGELPEEVAEAPSPRPGHQGRHGRISSPHGPQHRHRARR